jgi:hypothetical protein
MRPQYLHKPYINLSVTILSTNEQPLLHMAYWHRRARWCSSGDAASQTPWFPEPATTGNVRLLFSSAALIGAVSRPAKCNPRAVDAHNPHSYARKITQPLASKVTLNPCTIIVPSVGLWCLSRPRPFTNSSRWTVRLMHLTTSQVGSSKNGPYDYTP